jgi:hypothetical protein
MRSDRRVNERLVAITERHGLDLIVRHVDHRRAEVAVQLRDLAPRLHAQLRVEIRERLVEQKHGWLAHDRATNRDALSLPTRELSRLSAEHLLQAERLRGFRHAAVDLLL